MIDLNKAPQSPPDLSVTAPKLSGAQTGTAPIFGVRAWVNFDGVTGAIRASGNITSVVKNGTGDYTVNFTLALPSANYAVCPSVNSIGVANVQGLIDLYASAADGSGVEKTVTACRLRSGISSNGTVTDFGQVSVFFVG